MYSYKIEDLGSKKESKITWKLCVMNFGRNIWRVYHILYGSEKANRILNELDMV